MIFNQICQKFLITKKKDKVTFQLITYINILTEKEVNNKIIKNKIINYRNNT